MKFLPANSHIAFYLIWIMMILPAPVFADSFDSAAREGVTHYNREEFDKATEKFQESQLESPANSEVTYNLANSNYRLGRYEEAVEAYKKALGEETPPPLKQKSYYNMGNAYYRMGYMDEAIESYKKALELNPNDMDSKFNLEWTRKQQANAQAAGRIGPRDKNILKQQGTSDRANNPPSEQEKSKDSRERPPDDSQKQETAQKHPQDQPDTPEKPSSSSSQGSAENNASKDEKAVADALREMTEMSPEEAERWLGSLSEDLKSITRRQMQGEMKDMFADHDKDW
ncbi:MAG: tetratricopeptide repeat protein [Nitrospinota bacterium]|nr:tetratricopeptide repeat protein [Nitrospinota bacterium]